jgi:hypothetical protein
MNGLLAIPCQSLKDRPAGWVGEGLEDVICYDRHGGIIAMWLLVVKPVGRVSEAISVPPLLISRYALKWPAESKRSSRKMVWSKVERR